MSVRSRLLVALAFGALVSTTQLTACSSTDDRTDDTDGGSTTPDAGNKPDAGTTPDAGGTPDAGEDPTDHTVGAACTANANFEQGDCEAGLNCIVQEASVGSLFFPGGVCTKPCTTDTDCGEHDGSTNKCLTFGSDQLCIRGCDPIVVGSCGRGRYACNTDGANDFCMPSCLEIPALCSEGTTCDAASGLCKEPQPYDACPTGVCGAGAACLSFTQGAEGICLQECTSTACPTGFSCSVPLGNQKFCTKNCGGLTGGQCPATAPDCAQVAQGVNGCVPQGEAGTLGSYEECGQGLGGCVEGASCRVGAQGATVGICLVGCTTNANACTSGEQCTQASTTEKLCLRPCSGGQTCPSGSACSQGFCTPAAP